VRPPFLRRAADRATEEGKIDGAVENAQLFGKIVISRVVATHARGVCNIQPIRQVTAIARRLRRISTRETLENKFAFDAVAR